MHAGIRARALATGALATAALGFTVAQATAATTAQVENGTLIVTGTNGADDITLQLRLGQPDILEVDIDGDGAGDLSFDRSTFTAIDVQARGGDDRVLSRGPLIDEVITIDGGGGADTLTGGLGNQTLIGGSGNDAVAGGDGDDTARLGTGADRFTWSPGDDDDVVEGESGADVLDFNGSGASETIDVSANGSRVRLLRDVANVNTDLGGIERIEVDARAGSDTLVAGDVAGTELETFAVELGGDTVPDSVIIGGTPEDDSVVAGSEGDAQVVSGLAAHVQVTGGSAQDEINVGTGDGADTISTSVDVTGAAVFDVDGGDGVDTASYAGTEVRDEIVVVSNGGKLRTGGPASAPFDTIVEELRVQGLGGEDTLAAVGNTLSSHLTLDGGAAADTVRGGVGPDLLLGGSGNDLVDGNQGADIARLGSGADHFQWDPGDGSDTVEGEGGSDVFDFNGSSIGEILEVSANGERVRFTRNVANIVTDLNDVEGVAIRALGGADTITVDDLAGTDLETADVDLSSTDAQADTVIANGSDGADAVRVSRSGAQARVGGLAAETRVTGSEAALDALRVQTLAGDDEVTIASNLSDLIGLVVDLGADD